MIKHALGSFACVVSGKAIEYEVAHDSGRFTCPCGCGTVYQAKCATPRPKSSAVLMGGGRAYKF